MSTLSIVHFSIVAMVSINKYVWAIGKHQASPSSSSKCNPQKDLKMKILLPPAFSLQFLPPFPVRQGKSRSLAFPSGSPLQIPTLFLILEKLVIPCCVSPCVLHKTNQTEKL